MVKYHIFEYFRNEKETLKTRDAKNIILTEFFADIKKTWKTINETLNRNKNGCKVSSRFLDNGVELLYPRPKGYNKRL